MREEVAAFRRRKRIGGLRGCQRGKYVALVADVERVDTLAQIGLVFLMFSIGLQLSLRKMRGLGISLMFATFAGATVMYHLARIFAASLGWGATDGLFLAAMLIVSGVC